MTAGAAERSGIACYRLPIEEHLARSPKRPTHVMNVDTVVKVICLFVQYGDWQRTLDEAIPLKR
jgi:hypothetical protein